MEQGPTRQQDPLAIAVFGAALALLAGLLVYVFVFKTPEPAASARAPRAPGFVEEVERFVAGLAEKFGDKPAKKTAAKRAAKPAVASAPASPPVASSAPAGKPLLEAGRTWRYAVVVEPPVWRDITLTYRTQRDGAGIGVPADLVHDGGKTNFYLGIFAPGHPSHANMRFPGFFMYASYFQLPLQTGQRLSWEWAWQGGAGAGAGRVKRYEGRVLRIEDVKVPAGTFSAAVIDADLFYIEGGKVQAQARETLWYAPKVSQVVKVVRDGRTPDEAVSHVVAELAEYR